MTATETLRREHELILQGLAVLGILTRRLETGDPVESRQVSKLINFFRQFADGCHHVKEETFLFPALERHGIPKEGGPLGVMLREHEHARALLRTLAQSVPDLADPTARDRAIRASKEYGALMTGHISKENQVLFRMADQVLPPQAALDLMTAFAELDRQESEVLRDGEQLVRSLSQEYARPAV